MPIGPDHNPGGTSESGIHGFFDLLLFTTLSVVTGLLGGAQAAAVSIVASIRQQTLARNPNTPLDPGSVAVAVVKGVVDQGVGASEVELDGVSSERFDVLVKATGNAPSWGDLLDQWRRGLIGDAELDHGIRTGLLRNEWIPFVRNLRHVPLSAVQYLSAALRGHIDLGAAIAKADGLGIAPADAQLLYDSLGNPLGPVQMLEAWNRGIMTEEEAHQGFQESDYKNKYWPAFARLREYLVPTRSVTTLLRAGAITDVRAHELYKKNGLTDADATAYVASINHVKTAAHKDLAVSTVTGLYEDKILNRDQALARLATVGYGGADALLLLQLADDKAAQKLRTQAVNRIHTLFVSHRLDLASTNGELSKWGLDTDQQTKLLDLWKLEQGTPTKELTLAQLTALVKAGSITADEWTTRVQGLGYSAGDTALLATIDVPAPPKP